jgi:hypothetical protein
LKIYEDKFDTGVRSHTPRLQFNINARTSEKSEASVRVGQDVVYAVVLLALAERVAIEPTSSWKRREGRGGKQGTR